jgi:hypothetical protein
MGFIKVKKGKKIISVPRKTYERQFRDAGWVEIPPIDENIAEEKEAVKTVKSEKQNDEEPSEDTDTESEEDWDEVEAEMAEAEEKMQELLEKPVGELTPDEVKIVAEEKGIETKGKNIKQLREALKKAN